MKVNDQERELLVRLLCEPGKLAQNEKPIAQGIVDKLIQPSDRLWEMVGPDICGDRVRRMRIPGGWLYQVERFDHEDPIQAEPGSYISGWHPPIFVADGAAQIVERPKSIAYEPPERTAYRSQADGVYHPAPSHHGYARHCETCDICATEHLFTASQWEEWKQRLIRERGVTQGLAAYERARHERAELEREKSRDVTPQDRARGQS